MARKISSERKIECPVSFTVHVYYYTAIHVLRAHVCEGGGVETRGRGALRNRIEVVSTAAQSLRNRITSPKSCFLNGRLGLYIHQSYSLSRLKERVVNSRHWGVR